MLRCNMSPIQISASASYMNIVTNVAKKVDQYVKMQHGQKI